MKGEKNAAVPRPKGPNNEQKTGIPIVDYPENHFRVRDNDGSGLGKMAADESLPFSSFGSGDSAQRERDQRNSISFYKGQRNVVIS